MARVVRIHETGGPEKMVLEKVPLDPPAPGELQIRQTAIGLNYIDTYHRTGLYPVELPAVLGREAAGVVEAVGAGVEGFAEGDRVAYPMHAGAYADRRNIPARALVKLPDAIDDRIAAAMMLKGLTAHYLLRRTFRVEADQTVLFHAAAGGVGSIACPWAAHLGVTVIGTVGSPEKAELARARGCAHTILYNDEDFVARVMEITGGEGVPVVYDSVGQATFEGSLQCLSRRGMLVSFGQASGPIPPFRINLLAQKGSLYCTRPSLADYIATREELDAAAAELFDVVASGAVEVEVGRTYPLDEVVTAHRDLEGRRTTGSTVLLP